uniref:Uncharacterized protein n=1 Tax=Globodera pallida TaxID=36090 RepID=A0A183CEH9_GLOPA
MHSFLWTCARANAGEQLCRISQTLLRLRTAAIKAERAAKSQLKSGPDGTPVQPTAKDQRTGLATATEAAVQECKRTLADVLAPPGRRHQGERAAKALRTNAAPPAPIASDAKNKEQNIAPPTQLQHQPHQQRPELEIVDGPPSGCRHREQTRLIPSYWKCRLDSNLDRLRARLQQQLKSN